MECSDCSLVWAAHVFVRYKLNVLAIEVREAGVLGTPQLSNEIQPALLALCSRSKRSEHLFQHFRPAPEICATIMELLLHAVGAFRSDKAV